MSDDRNDEDYGRPKPTPSVTREMALMMHEMRRAGFVQHAIAARCGVNQGRVSEVLRGVRHPESGDTA